jgi:hypothetical protein
MKNTALVGIITVLIALTNTTQAETVCLRSRLLSGRIAHQTRIVGNGTACPAGYKALFNSGALTTGGPAGPQGPQGERGPQGLQGPQGATGPQGIAGSTYNIAVVIGESANNSVSPKTASATCPANSEVVGGFGSVDNGLLVPVSGVALTYQSFALTGQGFVATAYETNDQLSSSWMVRAVALCRVTS